VALKFNSADKELFPLVNINFEANHLLVLIKVGRRDRSEVDVSLSAVGLAQILQTLSNLLAAEDITILDGKLCPQRLGIAHRFIVGKGDLFEPVLVAFFNRNI